MRYTFVRLLLTASPIELLTGTFHGCQATSRVLKVMFYMGKITDFYPKISKTMSGIEKSDLLAIHVKSSQVSSKLQVGRTLFMRETIDSNKTDNLMDLKKRKNKLIAIVVTILIVIKPLYIENKITNCGYIQLLKFT